MRSLIAIPMAPANSSSMRRLSTITIVIVVAAALARAGTAHAGGKVDRQSAAYQALPEAGASWSTSSPPPATTRPPRRSSRCCPS